MFFTLEVEDLKSSNDVSPTTCNYWIPELNLTVYDKDVITKRAWLTDSVINAGLKLMKEAYPHIEGLQETSLGETLTFDVCKGTFVQVLNVGRNHWITVTSSGEYLKIYYHYVF